MKRCCGVLLSLGILVFLGGCATLFTGTQTPVNVTTAPAKANIVIRAHTGQVYYQGEAPAVVKLDKKNTYQVEISLTGYQTQTIMISQTVTGWFWANFCVGGLIGMGIDYVTGGMWDLSPSTIDVKLAVAMRNTDFGPAVVFLTRDDENQLRYIIVPMISA